jgi:hypothetical protein
MADEGAIHCKHERLAAETARYFGETCPALATRWQVAIVGLAPAVLRELAGRLRESEAVTNETNRGLETSLAAVAERRASAQPLLDRALACLAGC